jgi:hypothetical protein
MTRTDWVWTSTPPAPAYEIGSVRTLAPPQRLSTIHGDEFGASYLLRLFAATLLAVRQGTCLVVCRVRKNQGCSLLARKGPASGQRFFHGGGSGAVHAWQDVGVGVEGERDADVSEEFLNVFGVDVVGEELSGTHPGVDGENVESVEPVGLAVRTVPRALSTSQRSRYSPRVILPASKMSPPSLSDIAFVSFPETSLRVLP